MKLAQYSKFIVALTGAVATAVSQGLVDGDAAKWAGVGIPFVTALLVERVPNQQEPVEPQEEL